MTESLLFWFFLTLFAVMLPSTPLTLPISSHLPEWHVPLAFWFWKLIQNSSLQNSLSCLSPEGFLMEQQEGDCFCLSFTATFPAHWKTVCHDIRGTGKAYTTWVSRSLLYDTGKSEWSWNCVQSPLPCRSGPNRAEWKAILKCWTYWWPFSNKTIWSMVSAAIACSFFSLAQLNHGPIPHEGQFHV